jgi:DNA-binding MarR family transcriptional regulator
LAKTRLSAVCTNAALRRATRNIGRLYDEALAPSGLRATQFGLLAHIHAMDKPSMQALAEEMVMDLSALGHTLKPLIRDGLVKTVVDDADRRVKRIVLTRKGAATLEKARPLWRAAQKRLESIVGADEALRLRDALTRLASPEFTLAFEQGSPR